MSEWYPVDCQECDKPINGEWESQIALGIETGEISAKEGGNAERGWSGSAKIRIICF